MPVFSLKEAKDLQVKNVSEGNFKYWSESASYGYFSGGIGPITPLYCNIWRIDFSNDSTADPGKNLPISTSNNSGNSSASYGYFGGGGGVSGIYRLDFSTENVTKLSNNFPTTRSGSSRVSTVFYGYWGGGYISPNPVNGLSSVARLDYSSETINVPSLNFSQRFYASGSVSNVNYAYFGGGYYVGGASAQSNIMRLDLTSETTSNPTSTLGASLGYLAGTSNPTYGYFGGGFNGALYYNWINRLDFSNETNLVLGPAISARKGALAACSNNINGYYGGGFGFPAPTYFSTIDKIIFSTETVYAATGIPNNSSAYLSALSGGQSVYTGSTTYSGTTYGYNGGGFGSTISRMDFSTENLSFPGKNLPIQVYNLAAVSGPSYGYFGGGYSPQAPFARICTVYRLDFSTDNMSVPGKNLPSVIDYLAGTSTNYYGYFGGGYSYRFSPPVFPIRRQYITKLDFSTDTVYNNNDNSRALKYDVDGLAVVSNKNYGYFSGGRSRFGGLPPIPLTTVSNITRLDFIIDITNTPGVNLPVAINSHSGVSNNYYGYFTGAGSFNAISRLDFSNEIISLPGKNLPASLYERSSYSSKSYGYFIGGSFPTVNTIHRLDFSTETINAPGKNHPTTIASAAGIANGK